MQGYEDIINQFANGTLPTGEGTTPYLPNSTFSYKEWDLTTGVYEGSNTPSKQRAYVATSHVIYDLGFRIGLWK